MNNWLADSAPLLSMLLGTAAVVLAVLWWRTRRGWFLVSAALLGLCIGGIFLLMAWYPSDGKQIIHVVQDMSAALRAKDVDRIFSHISDKFSYRRHAKQEFRKMCEEVLRRRDVTECEVWNFNFEDVSRAKGTGIVSFHVKPKGNWGGGEFYLCKAEFVLEADGRWRMRTFEIFNPFVEQSHPIDIPGF
jgi:ketosteroid isomerase-like protein